MKVILLQDVAKIGKKGSVVEVPNGYAMNALIPQKKAAAATGANLKAAESKAAAAAANAADSAAAFKDAAATLKDASLVITATMNEQDHLFEAVSADAVVAAAAAAGVTIAPAMVSFNEPVKSAGEHEVALVSGDTRATFTITVTKA